MEYVYLTALCVSIPSGLRSAHAHNPASFDEWNRTAKFVQQKFKINIHSFAEMCLGMNSFRMTNERQMKRIMKFRPSLPCLFHPLACPFIHFIQLGSSYQLSNNHFHCVDESIKAFVATFCILYNYYKNILSEYNIIQMLSITEHEQTTYTPSILNSDLDCRIHANAFYHIP